jgi:beta-glucosidase
VQTKVAESQMNIGSKCLKNSYIVLVDLVGFGEKENANSTMETILHDVKRVDYMNSYLDALATAMRY